MRIRVKPRDFITGLLADCGVAVGGANPWDIQVANQDFYARVLSEGSLGLGESYMDGWWSAEDLSGFIFRLLDARIDERVRSWGDLGAYLAAQLVNLQRRSRAFQIGEKHYDIGNDLYARMLDRRMMYSCAYWEGVASLDAAQEAKLNLVFRKLDLQAGQRVLDVGCGWGGALQYAAQTYGVEGVGVTVSREQAQIASEVCAGLPVTILLRDYRDLHEQFDHAYSIGMFEHVGAKNYRTYMHTVHRCLRAGGRFLLHTIGSSESVNHTDRWIEKYIFPNSLIPSQTQIVAAAEGLFCIAGWQRIGPHYDPTLMAWLANFERHWPQLRQSRDERFYRMWRYYLCTSAAAFRVGKIDVWQVLLVPLRA